jgi:hypothetical protein
MFHLPGSGTVLPAVQIPTAATSALNAWEGGYATVRLTAPIEAIRVHLNGGVAASSRPELVGAGPFGRWFAIGDVIQTYGEYRATRALPAHFTHVAIATLLPGTVVNVGRCAPLFGHEGGGEQVEYVLGPWPQVRQLEASWSHQAGHA